MKIDLTVASHPHAVSPTLAPALDRRRKQWYASNKVRFNKRRLADQHNIVNTTSQLNRPPEYLRKIIKDHGDMSNARYRAERSIHAGALRYIPYAIFKVLENIPQPFEIFRDVKVLYHTSGAITFVNETPRVIPPVFIAQWATMWIMMRREKHDRRNFKRISLPPFDSEEPPVDYADNLQLVPSNVVPIEIDLDEREDDAVFDWFYDGIQPLKTDLTKVNGPSYKSYHLNVPILSNLYRLSTPLLLNSTTQMNYVHDPNSTYLFNRETFVTGKSLSYAVPSGPSFEPLFREKDSSNDNWTEFNDVNKLIIRRAIATEYRIALPYVFTHNPRCVMMQVQQHPLYCYIHNDDVSIVDTEPYEFFPQFSATAHHNPQLGFENVQRLRELERLKMKNHSNFIKNINSSTQHLENISDSHDLLKSYGVSYEFYQNYQYDSFYSTNYSALPAEYQFSMYTDNIAIPTLDGPKYINEYVNEDTYIYPTKVQSLWFRPNIHEDSPETDPWSSYQRHLEYDTDTMGDNDKSGDDNIICSFVISPSLSSQPLFSQELQTNTLSGLLLYHAPAPFNRTYGNTVPAQHVDLLKDWFVNAPAPSTNPQKVKLSYQKLLKHWLLTQIHSHKSKRQRLSHGTGGGFSDANGNATGTGTGSKTLLKVLSKQTRFFQQTTIDWLEAAIQVIRQGYNTLSLIIKRKRVEYLHLDYNFTLQPTRVLTTKERKHSRFGNSFHLIREILKLLKIVVDCHIRFRLGDIDSYQLADALQYTFNHVGKLTGIYRYKYRTMRQIKQCKDLKHLIYYKFNTGTVGKGPGVGFWHPSWRVWVFFLQGVAPLLEKWLHNLISRQFEGRQYGVTAKTVTRQRVDTIYDLELKKKFRSEILDMMPIEIRAAKARIIEQHLSEAWRCWRANIPWNVPGMPPQIESMITRYVKCKSDAWVLQAYRVRERLRRGEHLEKTVVKKNLGRLTRLALKSEQERQLRYLEGEMMSTAEATKIIDVAVFWLEARNFIPIQAPAMNYKHDTKLLTLTLEKLKDQYLNNTGKITTMQKHELTLIEEGFDKTDDTLKRIKSMLLNQRSFKEIEIEFYDEYNILTPVYTIDPKEKITDMYLDQYLWYEAYRRGLFPNWVKPADREPAPSLVYKICQNINSYNDIWSNEEGACTVLVQTQFSKMYDQIDLRLLNRLLSFIMDPVLADYITARYNCKITYKDMNHVNSIGIIRGIAFSTFVTQYYGLIMDLLILGLERAQQLAGPPARPVNFGSFDYAQSVEESLEIEQSHPIRMYCRYADKLYILYKLDGSDVQDITRTHLQLYPDPNNNNIHNYNNKMCWPRDSRMRLMRNDVNLGKAVFYHVKNRIPLALTTIEWADSFVSVYSKDNPQLLFSMMGFEVRLIPAARQHAEHSTFSLRDSTWSLHDQRTKEFTAFAYVRVEDIHVTTFSNRVRHMLMTSGNAPYVKLAQKWNSLLTSLMTYYREAVISTPELLDLLVKSENKFQTRIKVGLNSKMPQRFPPVLFYTPTELGGLGMLSMGHILIPESDRIYSKETSALGTTHFRAGMSNPNGETSIPVLYRYITTWEAEFKNSEHVWTEYHHKKQEAQIQNRQLGIDDMADMWDKGLPRVNTLFSKDRQTLWYDKGWRMRLEWRKYITTFHNNYWWTSPRHDGKLWSLHNYRTDVIQALGGVESILEHTLFKATYFSSWEGVFWEQSRSSFEEGLKSSALTKAQSQGLSQVPNRRFVLWWSPTINRGDVYIGYQVQLDLTGIFMHGKLPVLKVVYVQIFRAHLWQKIHESIVMDLCQVLDKKSDVLEVSNLNKEVIHPRKSYKMQSSCADITIQSTYKWNITLPYLITTRPELMKNSSTSNNTFWFDVQLRWGDYDQHDCESYIRGKYVEYNGNTNTSGSTGNDNANYNAVNVYPSTSGLMIGVDLAYNLWSAFGNFIPNLAPIVTQAMSKIIKNNPALSVLRERIRKAVQLYTSEPTEPYLNSSNFAEIFRAPTVAAASSGQANAITWFVDTSAVRRVTTHRTNEGNYTTKTINGALSVINPVTGVLDLKVIHASVWAGQKRLAQVSKWKSAEEICAIIRTLPQQQRPNTLIITEKSLLDPLQASCSDFPNMVLKGNELSIPFQSIYKLKKVGDIITTATEPKLVRMCLYDNWIQNTTNSFTCFSRLILLLRALQINLERAQMILYPNATVITQKSHLWPSLTDSEWANVERQLSDLILADFALKNNVKVESLTQREIQDIILGAQIETPTTDRDELIKELEGKANPNDVMSAINIQTTDQYGNIVVNTTTSNYERAQFISSNDWRVRYISTQQLYKRTNVYTTNKSSNLPATDGTSDTVQLQQQNLTFILPTNLFRQFIYISDIKIITMAYMYGVIPTVKTSSVDGSLHEQAIPTTRLVQALVIPPQCGTAGTILFTQPPNPSTAAGALTNAQLIANFIPLGLLYTIGQQDTQQLSPELCVQHVQWFDHIKAQNAPQFDEITNALIPPKYINPHVEKLTLQQTTTITISYTPGSCSLSSYTITPRGFEWVHTSPNAVLDQHGNVVSTADYYPQQCVTTALTTIQLTDKVHGFFITPFNKIWNYAFMALKFSKTIPYVLTIAIPIEHYHYLHRKQHFLEFVRYGQQQLITQQQQSITSQNTDGAMQTAEDYTLNQIEDEFFH